MKFRYKVLIINMIVISIGLGTIGYFMITKNFNLAMEQQIQNSVEENNLFQANIEYELLNIMDSEFFNEAELFERLVDSSKNVHASIAANDSNLYVAYNNSILYSSSDTTVTEDLWSTVDVGEKNYVITKKGDEYHIYVSSCTLLLGNRLHIINSHSITEIYAMMHQQSTYYKLLLVIVLVTSCVFMYLLSTFLTKPLEQLQQVSESFGNGNYDARISIDSRDEVGKLAFTYNTMADSVCEHMNELQDMITRQEQFVADFTHELKTPMTSIIGYADTLRSRSLTPEQQIMAASYIFSEGTRLENMSMKLFDFIYTKQHSISAKKLNVEKLMNQISSSVRPILSQKNLHLKMTPVNCFIDGDIELLKSAFINLIDNSRKASPDGSEIVFSCSQDANYATITVQDFGTGIPKEHLDKIYDAFYMVDKSRSRKEGGAGLGLSLSNLIFNAHNAKVTVDSEAGKGTSFSIAFPIHKEEDSIYEQQNQP